MKNLLAIKIQILLVNMVSCAYWIYWVKDKGTDANWMTDEIARTIHIVFQYFCTVTISKGSSLQKLLAIILLFSRKIPIKSYCFQQAPVQKLVWITDTPLSSPTVCRVDVVGLPGKICNLCVNWNAAFYVEKTSFAPFVQLRWFFHMKNIYLQNSSQFGIPSKCTFTGCVYSLKFTWKCLHQVVPKSAYKFTEKSQLKEQHLASFCTY